MQNENIHFHVVVMDGYLGWTRMDGPTCTQKIKTRTRRTRVIGSTSDTSLMKAFKQSGADYLLAKEASLDDLVTLVQKLLNS